MPRLLDDLRTKPVAMPWYIAPHLEEKWVEHSLRVGQLLLDRDLPVLLIDNVAEYYYESSDQEYWDLRDHFPNLAPPYERFWCEHRMPKVIHSKEKGDTDVASMSSKGRVGVLVHAVDPAQVKAERDDPVPPNVKWILWCELFIDFAFAHDRPIEGSPGPIFLAVDEHGVIVEQPWMQTFTDGQYGEYMRTLITWLHPVLLAISFLHCKNVKVEEAAAPPEKLAKAFRKRHNGIQMTRHKVLIIEPLKEILKREGKSGEVGAAKAMHICRGHFRDYREGRGLFGKYKQLVWTPAVVRGTKGKKAEPRVAEVRV